ncbi:MAG TPA: multifunctional CCA tRNA nucleotidyl transferase/2'3'-cyclic phosphodiesterase/2'nucleotidase/phosphatase, partial [Kineobactrum sp.]
QPERFNAFLLACEADARGRAGKEQQGYPQALFLHRAMTLARSVTAAPFLAQGLAGKALGEAIAREQVHLLDALHNNEKT